MFLMNSGFYTTASPLQRDGLFPSKHSSSVIQLRPGEAAPRAGIKGLDAHVIPA